MTRKGIVVLKYSNFVVLDEFIEIKIITYIYSTSQKKRLN